MTVEQLVLWLILSTLFWLALIGFDVIIKAVSEWMALFYAIL